MSRAEALVLPPPSEQLVNRLGAREAGCCRIIRINQKFKSRRRAGHAAEQQTQITFKPICVWRHVDKHNRGRFLSFEVTHAVGGM